jgi:hypothetical protein
VHLTLKHTCCVVGSLIYIAAHNETHVLHGWLTLPRYATLAAQLKDEELSLDRIGLPTLAEFAMFTDATDKDRFSALKEALLKLQPVNLTRLAAMVKTNDSMASRLKGKEVCVLGHAHARAHCRHRLPHLCHCLHCTCSCVHLLHSLDSAKTRALPRVRACTALCRALVQPHSLH